jgi:phage/plasmid-like protein (TIGR03299 family)
MYEYDTMFSVREAPWHKLGVVLSEYPSRQLAMESAGLNWEVVERELFARRGVDTPALDRLGDWKALRRSDNGHVLHVASDSYGVAQNSLGFEILEALLDQDRAIRYETGGSIKNGAQCYITAKVDEPVTINGDDSPTFPYVVVTWTHDGSGAMIARATNVRVVCWNTLSASEAEASKTGRKFTFRHTKNVASRVEDAKAALSGVRQDHAAFVEIANELAAMPVSDEVREKFITTFIPRPEGDVISDRVLDNILAARKKVRGTLDRSRSVPEAHRNTAYGLLLAGTEYLDHLRGFRNTDTYMGRTLLKDESLKAKLVPTIRELVAAG